MFYTCLLLVHYLLFTCSWLVYYLFMSCSWLDYNLSHAQDLFTTCSKFGILVSRISDSFERKVGYLQIDTNNYINHIWHTIPINLIFSSIFLSEASIEVYNFVRKPTGELDCFPAQLRRRSLMLSSLGLTLGMVCMVWYRLNWCVLTLHSLLSTVKCFQKQENAKLENFPAKLHKMLSGNVFKTIQLSISCHVLSGILFHDKSHAKYKTY